MNNTNMLCFDRTDVSEVTDSIKVLRFDHMYATDFMIYQLCLWAF